jgi:hypothetical protein
VIESPRGNPVWNVLLQKIFKPGYKGPRRQVTLSFVIDLNRMTIRIKNPECWTVTNITVDPLSFDLI